VKHRRPLKAASETAGSGGRNRDTRPLDVISVSRPPRRVCRHSLTLVVRPSADPRRLERLQSSTHPTNVRLPQRDEIPTKTPALVRTVQSRSSDTTSHQGRWYPLHCRPALKLVGFSSRMSAWKSLAKFVSIRKNFLDIPGC
jgi:hypothetical protein